jgi:hypothetical protein
MINILKYEWLKRWKLFAAGLVVFTITNIDLVFRMSRKSDPTFLSAIFIAVVFAMALALFFSQIFRMYSVLFTEEGLLTFTVPISGYHFLGGKFLAVVLECIGVGAFVGLTAFLDYQFLRPLIPFSAEMEAQLTSEMIVRGFQGMFLAFLGYLSFLLMVYLSMILAKSIFASVKHGKILSFVLFIVLTQVFSKVTSLINGHVFNYSLAVLGLFAACTFLFGASGYLIDRKINI